MGERKIFVAAAACLLLLTGISISGCGGATVPTSGVVMFDDGTPVQSGSIEFRRVGDKQSFASRISPDGTFRPAGEDGTIGLPAGTYDVVVVQIVLTEDLAMEKHTHGHTVPRRFADYYTSDLSVTVDEGQSAPLKVTIAGWSE